MSGQERSGWRDPLLSLLHKEWGFDCPAVDVDLFVEFDHRIARGLFELKHENARPSSPSAATNAALADLATRANVPLFGARYKADYESWSIAALNPRAKDIEPDRVSLSREDYVKLLYLIRCREMPQELRQSIRAGRDITDARMKLVALSGVQP